MRHLRLLPMLQLTSPSNPSVSPARRDRLGDQRFPSSSRRRRDQERHPQILYPHSRLCSIQVGPQEPVRPLRGRKGPLLLQARHLRPGQDHRCRRRLRGPSRRLGQEDRREDSERAGGARGYLVQHQGCQAVRGLDRQGGHRGSAADHKGRRDHGQEGEVERSRIQG